MCEIKNEISSVREDMYGGTTTFFKDGAVLSHIPVDAVLPPSGQLLMSGVPTADVYRHSINYKGTNASGGTESFDTVYRDRYQPREFVFGSTLFEVLQLRSALQRADITDGVLGQVQNRIATLLATPVRSVFAALVEPFKRANAINSILRNSR